VSDVVEEAEKTIFVGGFKTDEIVVVAKGFKVVLKSFIP
jgi:hypothetical protein